MIRLPRVLLPSDVFPPHCGGAGWSAHTLALALIDRGHSVTAIVPRRTTNHRQGDKETRRQGDNGRRTTDDGRRTTDDGRRTTDDGANPKSGALGRIQNPKSENVLGVPTIRLDYWAPRIPIIQNYFRFERLWPRLATALVELARADQHSLIIHAQHVQGAPAAVMAGRRLGAPVVVTVRDHWPWDYFNTGLHGDRLPYDRQTWASLATDLVARLGPARGALALPAIPYMLAHIGRRQQALRQADAVIAVSDYMARRLRGMIGPERLHVIPNMVDLAAIDAAIATPQTSVPSSIPYLLFVGKLERNKGAHLLIDIFRELHSRRPTTDDRRPTSDNSQFPILNSQFSRSAVIAGNGPLQPQLERELAALGVRARFLDWIDHDEVLRLMAGCELLLFPSAWGEPLSRVPLEASACGAAILAMPTGGTPSIIADGANGALEATTAGFARRLARLLAAPEQRRALGAAARRNAERQFTKDVVAQRVEELYHSLL